MATKRSTFQKRQRETDLKDKARAKEARRAAKRDQDLPNNDASLEAQRAQEAEIAAAIAAGNAASATIAHDTRRAAASTPGVTDAPAPASADAPPAQPSSAAPPRSNRSRS